MGVLFLVLGLAFVLWVLSAGQKQKQAVQLEVNERDRLAYLLVAEMKKWESLGGASANEVGPDQCLARGARWVLERPASVGVRPDLGMQIAKSAYCSILRDKLDSKMGPLSFGKWLRETEPERRGAAPSRGLEKWWIDVDLEYDSL